MIKKNIAGTLKNDSKAVVNVCLTKGCQQILKHMNPVIEWMWTCFIQDRSCDATVMIRNNKTKCHKLVKTNRGITNKGNAEKLKLHVVGLKPDALNTDYCVYCRSDYF